MAGELWRQQWEIGVETTPNTPVARTRKLYLLDGESFLKRSREGRFHKFATGTRQSTRAKSSGVIEVEGALAQPLSASEIVEFLLMALDGTVTPTGAGTTKLWTFKPGNTLDFCSVGWDDGARPWRGAGIYGNKLKIKGDVKKGTTVTLEVFGMSLTQAALTGGLTDRVPVVIEGWESKLFIDALGGTPGTTQKTGLLINWDIELDNMMARKHFAENSASPQAITPGDIAVKAKFLFEASAAQSLTEYDNWDADTERLVRLDFGNNVVIDGADKEFVTVDLPGAWESVDLGQTDENTRAYEFSMQYVYDTTNAFGLQVRAQNARATAY